MDDVTNSGGCTHSGARHATYRTLDDELFELVLSRENKTELFAEAISQLSQRSHESASIIETLEKWSPSDASRFKPRSASTILDTPFRLVFPQSALASFEDTGLYVRQYLAISYCWHSDEFKPQGYKRHGSWPISKPFVNAILQDKDHPREGIWIDQLCIDQESSIDKGKSVAAMDVIYRSCIRLVVLLEDVFLNEKEMRLHEKYDPTKMKFESTWQPESDDREAFVGFYNKVNAARWWQRAWCLHEFSVNDPWTDKRQCHHVHNATFILNGPESSTVKIKWVNLQLIMASTLYMLNSASYEVLNAFNGQYIFGGTERGDRSNDGMRSSLMARHNGVIQKGSLYLADRVSIVLNMSGLGLAYVGGQIKTEEEMFYLTTILALARGEMSPLSMFGGPSILLEGEPSWLAQSIGEGDTSIPKFRPRHPEGIHRISTHNIELDMIFFNSGLESLVDGDLGATYLIFPDMIRTTHPVRHVGIESHDLSMRSHTEANLDKFRRAFLARCILNGHLFTSRLWKQLKRQVVKLNYNGGIYKDFTPNPALGDAAQVFMRQLLPISSLMCVPPPQEFTYEDAHLFLTWLTDSRSMYYIGVYAYCLSCTRSGDHVFMTSMHVNEQFSDGPAEDLRFAVPIDALDSTCMACRVWVLRPQKGEEEESRWRLVGKALLLGEPDLLLEAEQSAAHADAFIGLREHVMIGG
ncbi:hypothetical protein IQ06DRAFT_294165 [Phaeosphaeriaceae sp. SRC1lsM3a]|nr:hypothetical protein IQ06DRAFT_294165 [Stagonospora sp. SRC1lsM3a]